MSLIGYAHKAGGDYSIIGKNGKKVSITKKNFPKFIDTYGARETLLAVSYYISNVAFRKDYNEECKQEIRLAIGDKG